GDAADFGNGRRELCELRFARTAAGSGTEKVDLAVDELDVATLGDDDVLAGELVLDAHGAARGVKAHDAGSVDACGSVLGSVADGDGLRFDLRGVNGERGRMLDVSVDGAGVERDCESAA